MDQSTRMNFWKSLICLVVADRLNKVNASGGPLGAPAGAPPGTVPAGTDTPNYPSQSNYSRSVRALDTVIAVLCILLTTTTYAILISPGTRLLSTSKIPLVVLERNVGNLLSRSWPDKSDSPSVADLTSNKKKKDAVRLLYVGRMDGEQSPRAARGVHQCQATLTHKVSGGPMWLTSGSSLTKSMVQLAVWEWVGFWCALGMTLSTLAFNGLLTNQRSIDSLPRLVVVIIYDAGFCIHFWYVFRKLQVFFTLFGAGSSWSLLNKASFASVDLDKLEERLNGGKESPPFKQIGKPADAVSFPIIPAVLAQDVGELTSGNSETLTDAQRGEAKTVGDWQKRDITSCVESGKSALEGVVANTMTMIGIVITTGFATWTTPATSATAQLGSLALLASLSLGSAAMFSSAVDLSLVVSSFRNVLFLKEIMINGEQSGHVQKRTSTRRVIGFTHKTVELRSLQMVDLAKLSRFWPFILFGPAHTLLPSVEDHERQSADTSFELRVSVRDQNVLLTTESTDRHNREFNGTNAEAINVIYEPRSQPIDHGGALDDGEKQIVNEV